MCNHYLLSLRNLQEVIFNPLLRLRALMGQMMKEQLQK